MILPKQQNYSIQMFPPLIEHGIENSLARNVVHILNKKLTYCILNPARICCCAEPEFEWFYSLHWNEPGEQILEINNAFENHNEENSLQDIQEMPVFSNLEIESINLPKPIQGNAKTV